MSYHANSSIQTPTGKIHLPCKGWRQVTSTQLREYKATQPTAEGGRHSQNQLCFVQQYNCLEHLVRHHKAMLPKPKEDWRLIQKPVSGHINGLAESMYGIAIATNGIMVAIEDPQLDLLFYGHLEWFVRDTTEESDLDKIVAAKVKKPRKLDEDFKDYVA